MKKFFIFEAKTDMKSILTGFAIIFLASIAMTSCTKEGLVSDFSDMNALSDSIAKIYPNEKIRIKISNGQYLSVSFVNSDLKDLDKVKKQKIAENVGLIARNFFTEDRIYGRDLTFVIYNNYIIYKYTEAIDTYDLKLSKSVKKE